MLARLATRLDSTIRESLHGATDVACGKVSATYQTWTHESELATWADNGDQARAILTSRLAAQ